MKKFIFLFFTAGLLVSTISLARFSEDNEPYTEKTPKEVLDAYVKAIGGAEKIRKIKTLVLVMEAEVQGMAVEMSTVRDMENLRMMQQVIMEGNVVQKTVVNNSEGYMSAMGQVQALSPEQLETLKTNIYAFPELYYEEMGFNLKMGENTEIDGEPAYTLLVTSTEGLDSKEYYSVESGFKLKMTAEIAGDVEFRDYQEVEGVKFPMKVSISNAVLPVPLETRLIDIQINQKLDDSLFE
ncbi:peptidase, M16 family protein [Cyclobacterium jeungdonense]|uniref:Peptidase, M16 family protein n=1 Tax=Cyclobacterium jeungdonense TaxID=708087 RepID=A0ABT8CA64_9BACT|nr:peptidase, M16 family protein [Cyclobacterium jeungdonense]MDN3689032.1 peptidase, M16 family protein [Cyclobacterium jeungdonense]